MKKKTIILIILAQVALFGGIFLIVSVLQTQNSTAPQDTSALSTDTKVVNLGDSISVDPPGSDLYYHYPSLLKSVYNVTTSDSYAVGGSQTGTSPSPFRGMRLQYTDFVAGKGYNILIVLGGVNDVASGVAASTTEANLDWMYSQAKAAGMKVVAISILPWGCFSTSSPAKMTTTKAINTWIKSNTNVDYFIDAYDDFSDGSDCLKASYNLDNIHVNRAGHDKLALMIYNQVFQGVNPTPMPCGAVGCSTVGDDAACGWPTISYECKSGYNNGEGRCEIVCTGSQTKIDACTCSNTTPTPTITGGPTPTLTTTPTVTVPITGTISPTATTTQTVTPTVSPTGIASPTPRPTNTVTPTNTTVPATTRTPTRTFTPTKKPTSTDNTIPHTALDNDQISYLVIGGLMILLGLYFKNSLNRSR